MTYLTGNSCGSVNIKLSHKLREFNINKAVYASTHMPADISVRFFAVFGSTSLQLNDAVFQQSERFVLWYKFNRTAPDNGYCKGRQRERERENEYLTL
jgi:hypothetical protein